MESARKGSANDRKKPSRDWLEKDQKESVISSQSLSCTRVLLWEKAVLKVLVKMASKADKWKEERHRAKIENVLSS